MNPKYVTSLKLSQDLQDLGVPQKSIFWWSKNVPQGIDNKYHLYFRGVPDGKSSCGYLSEEEKKETCHSAFLSGELEEKLKPHLNFLKKHIPYGTKNKALLYDFSQLLPNVEIIGKTLAYLIKNKLI